MTQALSNLSRDGHRLVLLRRWSALAALSIGLAVTWAAWSRERAASTTIHAQRFQEGASSAARVVEERFRDVEQALRSARAYVESTESINEAKWESFAGILSDQVSDCGVARLSWFERVATAEGTARYVAMLCAPADHCDGVIGVDAATIPLRREAMDLASETGRAILSRAESVADGLADRGVVMRLYLPVYRSGAALPDSGSVRGWVSSPILMGELFASIGGGEPALVLHMFDVSDGGCEVLHDTGGCAVESTHRDEASMANDPAAGRIRAPFRFGGRELVLSVRPQGPSPRQAAAREAFPTAVIGGVMSALLALWVRASTLTRVKAEKLALQMTESLRRSEQRYEMVTRASAAGIWEWRIVEDRMQLSPRLARMTGVGDQDLGSGIDSWVDLVVHAEDRVEFRSMVRGHVEFGKPFDVRVRVRWASGEYRWVHCNGVAARDAENRATVMAGSVIDVHEQHQAEERLERHAQDLLEANEVLEAQAKELASKSAEVEASRAAADAANRAKSDFLAHLSHEIRTPMTAILGFADVLAEEARSGPALSAWLDHLLTIRRNGEHLLGLVNDVLDMSKIEAGRMTVERIACSPMGVARDVVAMLGERAGAKGLALRLEAGEDVPALILTDPLRLRQILTNLVGNAVKFTERGSVTVRICRDDDHLAFEVIDTGIGLTSEQLTRLFLPFEQADATTARRFGGTGLGLAISSRLAELLGGGVEAYSTPGEGSRFVLTIKAPVAAAASRAEAEAGGAVGASPGGSLGGSRILLAEDGPDNQRLISFHLRRAGAAVEIVGDGRAALDRALAADRSGDPYDVVLMDVQMPEMDGLAATRALRQAGYRGAILALTASAMSGDRERCLEAGCDDYAAKPIDRDALLAACGRWSRERVERVAA